MQEVFQIHRHILHLLQLYLYIWKPKDISVQFLCLLLDKRKQNIFRRNSKQMGNN